MILTGRLPGNNFKIFLPDLVLVILQLMKDVIHDSKILLDPIEQKIPVRLKMNLSVSESIQMRIVTRLQAACNMRQALFCFLEIIQYIGCSLRVLFCKQKISDKSVQIFFRIRSDHYFIFHTSPSYQKSLHPHPCTSPDLREAWIVQASGVFPLQTSQYKDFPRLS